MSDNKKLLEIRKKEVEIARVTLGKDELELKVLELESQIERLKENILISDKRIKELNDELTILKE